MTVYAFLLLNLYEMAETQIQTGKLTFNNLMRSSVHLLKTVELIGSPVCL
jgi:hypothetical protein